MIYYPHVAPADFGIGAGASLEAPVVVDPGTPVANIMILVPEFTGAVATAGE